MFASKLVFYLRRLFKMARPKVIKLEQGEVVLRNLPKEKQDEIAAMLLGEKALEEETAEAPAPVDVSNMNSKTLGLTKATDGRWKLVNISYNHETMEAAVTSVVDAGDNKAIALGMFKVKMVEEKIV